MNQELISKYRYLYSNIKPHRFPAFIFAAILILFLFYYFLLHDNRIQTNTFILYNKNATAKPFVSHIYTYVSHDKLVPDFVNKIINKAQPPATCLILIRTADGAIGNRMFLFSSAYGLARLHQCELYVAPWILQDLRSIFTVHLNETPIHLITNDSIVNQTGIYGRYSGCTLYDDLLKIPLHSNLTLYEMTGFYQAFGYFVKYRDEIDYLFQFNQPTISLVVPLVEQLLKGMIVFVE